MKNFAGTDEHFTKNTSWNCKQVDEIGVGEELKQKYSPSKNDWIMALFLNVNG